ncbi:MAG: hypothetical protein Q9Q40_05005 [Acidobacteriota bacterium]|nr:hypothetical protein [Acidobacteriota bacterium]MDQ7087445.1 hypothetical protein [Acidobacteriota bacterium]
MSGTTIEIKDRDDEGLPAVELGDILPLVEEKGRTLKWAILNLYAVGNPHRLGRTMRELGDEVSRSPHGVLLNWDELEEFSRSVFQIMDAVIVGCRDAERLPRKDEVEQRDGDCEIVIRAIDASRWRLSAMDDSMMSRFRHVFRDWSMVGEQQGES